MLQCPPSPRKPENKKQSTCSYRFFTDRYPQQDLKEINWFPESMAMLVERTANSKRIWIDVDVPSDKQLWPEAFEGESVPTTAVRVNQ